MARWHWLLSAALAASAVPSVATVQAQEENEKEVPVSLDEIPAPARQAIRSHVGGGTIMEVVETLQGRVPEYEARIRHGHRKAIIWVDAAGTVLGLYRGV